MKININLLQLIGFIFTSIGGIILHYLYDLTNLTLVAPFSGVNESTWEHIKLVIAPTFLWLIIEYHFYYMNPNLFFARFIGLLVMI